MTVRLTLALSAFTIAIIIVSASATTRADDAATLAVKSTPIPSEVAEPIRAALDEKAITLSTGDKPFFEFWFRKQLPLAKEAAGGTLAIDTLAEGTVLGVVRVNEERRDFRDEELPPGIYVIRLGIQPEDGNHQGVAPTRTFALLIPAAKDIKLDPIPHKDLMKAASVTNAIHHPTNLNLQSVEDTTGRFPRLEERNDGQHKVVLLQLPAKLGDSAATLTFALVYAGIGQTS